MRAAASRTPAMCSPNRSTGTHPSSITWRERRVSGRRARAGLASRRTDQSSARPLGSTAVWTCLVRPSSPRTASPTTPRAAAGVGRSNSTSSKQARSGGSPGARTKDKSVRVEELHGGRVERQEKGHGVAEVVQTPEAERDSGYLFREGFEAPLHPGNEGQGAFRADQEVQLVHGMACRIRPGRSRSSSCASWGMSWPLAPMPRSWVPGHQALPPGGPCGEPPPTP